MIDGKKTIIENIEVFAWSFTARPIMLAIPSDTAIKIARLIKYILGFSGISALKTIGAATYKIMLIMNKWIYAERLVKARPKINGTPFAL